MCHWQWKSYIGGSVYNRTIRLLVCSIYRVIMLKKREREKEEGVNIDTIVL